MYNFFSKITKLKSYFIVFTIFFISSCSTIDSTLDSVSDAGEYIYDSIIFWEDSEPEESEALVIEELIQVPDFAESNSQENFDPGLQNKEQNFSIDPVYRSARQYYYVNPNGSPMPAPAPPPFPQYSVDRNQNIYSQPQVQMNYGYQNFEAENQFNLQNNFSQKIPQMDKLSYDEEMELYGIENNCIRVVEDYMNGGFKCDDFD